MNQNSTAERMAEFESRQKRMEKYLKVSSTANAMLIGVALGMALSAIRNQRRLAGAVVHLAQSQMYTNQSISAITERLRPHS
jgi:hypothetical protein